MPEQVRLAVYRRLDNRFEGLDDQSARGVELHNLRRAALHEALDDDRDVVVLDWDATDDTESHELVELLVALVSSPVVTTVATGAMVWLASRVEDAVSDVVVDGIKSLIQRLLPQQKQRRILDFSIELPNNAVIQVYPEDDRATITVSTAGDSVTISFDEVPDRPVRGSSG